MAMLVLILICRYSMISEGLVSVNCLTLVMNSAEA